MAESNTIAARFVELRGLVEGLSAREVDRLAGQKQGRCARVEGRGGTGQVTLHPDAARAYARVFGCTPEWLTLGTGKRPPQTVVVYAVGAARDSIRAAASQQKAGAA